MRALWPFALGCGVYLGPVADRVFWTAQNNNCFSVDTFMLSRVYVLFIRAGDITLRELESCEYYHSNYLSQKRLEGLGAAMLTLEISGLYT